MTTISAPEAPELPAEVDDAFEEPAVRLFESQVEDYENAVAARAAALEAAQTAAEDRAEQESDLNEQVTWAAAAAILIVLFGPLLYGLVELLWLKSRDSTGRQGA